VSKVRTIAAAIGRISDGAVVALGGAGSRRVPMAAVREIMRQGRRNIQVVAASENPGLVLLASAGCAASIDGGAAPRLRAAALCLGMLPLPGEVTFPAAAHVKSFTDPFTGHAVLAVAALIPDVAILHAHRADAAGNVQIIPDSADAFADDLMLARAARAVIVTVEEIVSTETIASNPALTVLAAADVTCVVEAPFGAHPFALDNRYTADAASRDACRRAATDPAVLDAWLADHVTGPTDHWDYLDRVGARALMAVSLDRASRA
jgi:glutaconate CoA-transferase subunit A